MVGFGVSHLFACACVARLQLSPLAYREAGGQNNSCGTAHTREGAASSAIYLKNIERESNRIDTGKKKTASKLDVCDARTTTADTLRTSVKQCRWCWVGVPKCTVRVTSVVPSVYWPPESCERIKTGPCVCRLQRNHNLARTRGDKKNNPHHTR